MLKLAKAYKGYKIDLPAFLDFRGRIYRCGLLHFHECDLSRSLINFAFSNPEMPANSDEVIEALLYHYKSYPSLEEAGISFNESLREAEIQGRVDSILLGREARHPFQFIAAQKALVKKKIEGFPVTKDASASAFPIMSYFLLDEDMAKSTNLLPSKDKKIQDIYTNILSEVKEYIVRELGNNSLSLIVVRKMVKSIFMPMIYGKTLMSTSSDIHKSLSQHINFKDSHILASLWFKFWKEKYKGLDSLTSLIKNIGWFAAAKGVPVYYDVPHFRTSQGYMKSDVVKITVYDRNHKRRQISLRVHTDNKDRRKTEVSTFVNFIHQKDAYIAME
ncbi:probable DNA-directed RNA polymerase [Lycium barbarum]|uniref:probable DNA-directed RNA polymerase n=1 Tax=Lycium barbarum TaxID=112863 RepID=UPI00293F3250|nr:probable DNA-directed RNA polymerase [Lycium barbarum]